MLRDLLPLLRCSLARLERLDPGDASPLALVAMANALAAHASGLQAAAIELEERAHAQLGRYAGEVVEYAARTGDALAAAESVAEAFLRLGRAASGSPATTGPSTRWP